MLRSALLTSIIFFSTSVVAAPTNLWSINIFKGPAPPPDQGPPLSAGATRDRSKLKYEVIGIAGAYVVWLLITLVLILFVGKRLRRRAQTSNRTLSMEMVKSPRSSAAPLPPPPADTSPLSPRSPTMMASLKSWTSGGRRHSHKQSTASMSTVDEKILESDKARNMDQMTKLYAAVMAHDEERSQRARSSTQTSPQSPQNPMHTVFPTPPLSPQPPFEFQHLRGPGPPPNVPRGHGLSYPMAPPPVDEDVSYSTSTSRSSDRQVKVSPVSFISHGHNNSAGSQKHRPSRISVRGLPISQPMPSADLREVSMNAVDGAMSPRIYTPGPPPAAPTPGHSSVFAHPRDVERKKPTISLRNAAAMNSTNNLPFRQFYEESLKSAPATKTTFVDRLDTVMATHPKTGLPQTPYSAYMPYTPMTPVTPKRLMNRDDLKRNKKKEGLKVLSEDDMVMSDEDMWGEVK